MRESGTAAVSDQRSGITRNARPLVGIVTPVYNEEHHLPECIESVIAQTYTNWTYTIVDNCSTDKSLEIARRYAAKDPRIQVHESQSFLPAIANHNRALQQIAAGSKYCKVVLGDDWIFPECLEQMVSVAEENPTVGIVSAYALEGRRVNWTGLPFGTQVISGREICRKHLLDNIFVFGTPTTVLYRADLVREREIFYNEANIHADTEVCFALLRHCDFAFIHQVLSFTRERQGSLSAKAADIHAYFGSMLHTLTTYGEDYLAEDELRTRMASHLSAYYKFLGKSMLTGRDRQFWEYHRKTLVDSGAGFSVTRLMQGAMRTIGEALTHPKYNAGKLLGSAR